MRVQFNTIQFNNQTFASKYNKLPNKEIIGQIKTLEGQENKTQKEVNTLQLLYSKLLNKNKTIVKQCLLFHDSQLGNDLESLINQVFTKAFLGIDRFTIKPNLENGGLTAWLRTITRNTYLNYKKTTTTTHSSGKFRTGGAIDLLNLQLKSSARYSPDDYIRFKELFQQLKQLFLEGVKELPSGITLPPQPTLAQMVIPMFYEDKSDAELAKMMKISEITVRSRRSKFKKELLIYLETYKNEYPDLYEIFMNRIVA